MQDFLAALALVLVIEGLIYAAAPDAIRRALAVILTQPTATMRVTGLVAASRNPSVVDNSRLIAGM